MKRYRSVKLDTDKPEIIDMADDYETAEESSYADVPAAEDETVMIHEDEDAVEDNIDAGFSELLAALSSDSFSDEE